jgi:HK97 family phage portal protein
VVWPFRRTPEVKAAVSAPVNTVAVPHGYGLFLSPSEVTAREAWMLYQNVATFAKVVDLIADNVASLTPLFMIDGRACYEDHPLHKFFKRPGFNRTRRSFVKELAVQQLVTGTGYLSIIGNTARDPAAFDILKTTHVTPVQGQDMWPASYMYSEGSRSSRFERIGHRDFRWVADYNEILPIYDMDGNQRGIGLSRLSAIKMDIDLRLRGTEHNISVMDQGARPSGAMVFKERMDDKQAQSIGHQIRSEMSGPQNAGRMMVLSGGQAEFVPFSLSPKDMDWANLVKMVEESIVARYGVPNTIYTVEAQTDNNYETAWHMFYDNAVLPTFQILFDPIANMLSQRTGVEITIKHDTSTNNILFRQAAARAMELKGAGMISVNEGRLMFGKEAVIGGDIMYGSAGEVPQMEDYFTDHMPGDATHMALPKPPEEEVKPNEPKRLN